MVQNEDYKDGMRFLLAQAKYSHIELRHLSWIPQVCYRLSKANACKAFWVNTFNQGNLKRIPLCRCSHDLFHTAGRCLFIWSQTKEGHSYWNEIESELFPCSIHGYKTFIF